MQVQVPTAQLGQVEQVVPRADPAVGEILTMREPQVPVERAGLVPVPVVVQAVPVVRIQLETQTAVVSTVRPVPQVQPRPMRVQAAVAAAALAVVRKGEQAAPVETEVASMVAQRKLPVAVAVLEPIPVVQVEMEPAGQQVPRVRQVRQVPQGRILVASGCLGALLEQVEMVVEPEVAAAAAAAVGNFVHSATTELGTEQAVAAVAAKVVLAVLVVAEEVPRTAFISVQMVQTA